MVEIEILGLIAGCFTTSAFLPQVIKVYKTKSGRDLSIGTLITLLVGLLLWVVYGIEIKSYAIIIANSISFMIILSLLYLICKYKNEKRNIVKEK